MRIPLGQLVCRVLPVLEAFPCTHLVYGGIALSAWANQRDTHDVDLVVDLPEDRLADLLAAFRAAGFRVAPDAETLFPIDKWTRVHFADRHADIAQGRAPFDASALARRATVRLFGRDVPIARAEDLILYKLVAHRLKDLADVEAILRRQRGKLDLAYLRRWARDIAAGTGKHEVPAKLEEMLEALAD